MVFQTLKLVSLLKKLLVLMHLISLFIRNIIRFFEHHAKCNTNMIPYNVYTIYTAAAESRLILLCGLAAHAEEIGSSNGHGMCGFVDDIFQDGLVLPDSNKAVQWSSLCQP